jgi:hypothetical protein
MPAVTSGSSPTAAIAAENRRSTPRWQTARSGHEDQFLPLRLSARSVIRKQTFAGTPANEQDAPITATQDADTPRDYGRSESTLSLLLNGSMA